MRLATFLVAAALLVPVALVPGASTEAKAHRYVVGFEPLPEEMAPGDTYRGGEVLEVNERLGFAVVETRDPDRLAGASEDTDVRYVEEDRRATADFTPNDEFWSDQYGARHIRADHVWDTTLGTSGPRVCVLDTGIRDTHEDIDAGRLVAEHDFANDDGDAWDDDNGGGHGTATTSIIAASIDNTHGLAGLAQTDFMAAKVLDETGTGFYSDIADAMQWCTDNGAEVISMSLGGTGITTTLEEGIEYAADRGVLLVAAAGNDGPCSGCADDHYPAAHPDVISVGCTDDNKDLCDFSSTGSTVELAAPGYRTIAAGNDDDSQYYLWSGTSFSTPHVSGTAALMLAYEPGLLSGDLRQLMQENAVDLGPSGRDNGFGYGLVDGLATLNDIGEPPFADAGPDQTVVDDDRDGEETVGLDGTGSYDPDGSVTSYTWIEDGSVIATGATPSVTFSAGVHDLTLRVEDDDGFHAEDTVQIEVNIPPIADAGSDQTVTDSDGGGEDVTLDGSGSTDLDGSVTSYEWIEDGSVIATGVSPTVTLSAGDHLITLRVTDGDGLTDEDQVLVKVIRGFFEDFEDNPWNRGWSKVDASGGDEWLWESQRRADGTYSAGIDIYDANEDDTLLSPTIDLTGIDEPLLTLDSWMDGERGFDLGTIEVSEDGGTTWRTLRENYTTQPSWHPMRFRLDPEAGSTIQLRFHFESDDSDHGEGWYVDNVIIRDDPKQVGDEVLVMPDDRDDAVGSTFFIVDDLDILRLAATNEVDGDLTFRMKIADFRDRSVTVPTGAQGAIWRVEWQGPQGVDFVEFASGPFGEACQYGRVENGQYRVQGQAPCTVEEGMPGKLTLTFPDSVLDQRGYLDDQLLTGVEATTHAFYGASPDGPFTAGLVDQYDRSFPALHKLGT